MAKSIILTVLESADELKKAKAKAAVYQRPRVAMLLFIASGITDTATLAAKTGADRNSICNWKKRYRTGGLQALLADSRGGDKRSALSDAQKQIIAEKMHNPKDAFTSYIQARQWLQDEHGIIKNYHALNKYLKRNYGAKLKVGRKSHVKKSEEAVAFFKKPGGKP